MNTKQSTAIKNPLLLTNNDKLRYCKTVSLMLGLMGAGLLGATVAALLQLLIQIKGIETAFLAAAPCLPVLLICFDRHNMAAHRRLCFAVGIAMGLIGGCWCGIHGVTYFTEIA